MAAVLVRRLRAFFLPERGALHGAPYGVVVAAAVALGTALALTGPFQRLEWAVYDASMRRAARVPDSAPDVVVVALDELSFAEIGLPWPWPRALHARLVDSIAAHGPASIAFDVVFETPTAPEGDEALAAALRAARNVVLGADRAPIDDRNYSVVQWSEPLPLLAEAAAAVGVVTIPFDPDGALRRAVFEVEGRPTLAAAALARAGAAPPPDPGRYRLIRFNGAPRQGIITVSYYQALDAATLLPPRFFSGKHVFVGRSLRAPASDQADYFRTPVALQMAGVEVHATIADAVLRRRFVSDPLAGRPALVAACVAFAALVAAVAFVFSPGVAAVAAAGLSLMLFAGAYAALASANLRVPAVAPILAGVAAYAGGAAYRFTLTNRERRLIKRAFKNFVAPAIVDEMLNDPSKLKLGGEEYDVTVLFSDLEGFTTLSERLTPQQLTSHLTGYFREMINGLLVERATLDKLIGDAIMVYFGCPIPDARHPAQACRGALAMQRRMTALNVEWAREGLPLLRTRIGINTGTVVAGNMGTDTIFNYTVLGDTVNLASRLEGVNKEYGTLIIAGEDTRSRVEKEFEWRELDWIRVKGKQEPVAIHELICEAGALDPPRRELLARFAAGLAAYRAAQWADAAAHFAAALEIEPSDGPSLLFADRCARYGTTGAPAAWDGVHVMHTK